MKNLFMMVHLFNYCVYTLQCALGYRHDTVGVPPRVPLHIVIFQSTAARLQRNYSYKKIYEIRVNCPLWAIPTMIFFRE